MLNAALIVVFAIIIYNVSYSSGFRKGWNVGADAAFNATADSVIAICERQRLSDTSRTKLVILNPDTTVIYLSRKSVLPNK